MTTHRGTIDTVDDPPYIPPRHIIIKVDLSGDGPLYELDIGALPVAIAGQAVRFAASVLELVPNEPIMVRTSKWDQLIGPEGAVDEYAEPEDDD